MNEDTGKLILRLALGVLILLHGIGKVTNGIDWIGPALDSSGLPAFLKYGVYVGELVAPLMVIAGFHTRIGAWLIAINMLFAIGLVHWGEIAIIENSGGLKIEKQYMYLFSAIALGLMGGGRYGVNQK